MKIARRSSSGVAQQAILAWALGAVAAIAIAVAAYLALKPANGELDEPETRPFTASDFKWPALIKHLHKGSLKGAMSTDEAVFVLYYLKEMNEVFGDPDMKVFIDAQCFTQVFDSEMSARLLSMFWTQVLPKALWELAALIKEDRGIAEAMRARYPLLSGVIEDLTRDSPKGTMDRLFILGNLPRILQAKARQDALTLFSSYGCDSTVTRRTYSNAVLFVRAYETAITTAN